jgi:NAD+ synthase (glutamine-hydrolysing)
VCAGGSVVGAYHKRRLPNYAVFDEARYFLEGTEPLELFRIGGVRVGVSVCEDVWVFGGPVHELGGGGAELIVNVNASPYHTDKLTEREAMLAERAGEAGCPIVYVNQAGGQDELVFDGASMVVGTDGRVLTRAAQFDETLLVVDVEVAGRSVRSGHGLPVVEVTSAPAALDGPAIVPPMVPRLDRVAEVYAALVTGTRDYVTKNGFAEVVLGLSGGIDSSLVATVAADALGRERVHGVLMPSRYSSAGSITDAEALADNLGIEHRLIPIEPAFAAFGELLAPSFSGLEADLTEENLQSRIRGVLLMALSNKFGWMVLTTSNKSESAVGYSTLYGDSAGGFAVIKDVPKLLVYDLCRYRNERGHGPAIPQAVIDKPPSAELRPGQRDDQSLPPYEVLDPLIEAYVEDDRTAAELVELGFAPEVVRRIVHLVDVAEYKRRQFPPGVRITTKAFGKDRRLPITNGYRG